LIDGTVTTYLVVMPYCPVVTVLWQFRNGVSFETGLEILVVELYGLF